MAKSAPSRRKASSRVRLLVLLYYLICLCKVRYLVKLNQPWKIDFTLRSCNARAALRASHIWAVRDRKAGSSGAYRRTDGKQFLHIWTRLLSRDRLRSIGDIEGSCCVMTWRAWAMNWAHCWVFWVQAWRRQNRLISSWFLGLGIGNHFDKCKLRA